MPTAYMEYLIGIVVKHMRRGPRLFASCYQIHFIFAPDNFCDCPCQEQYGISQGYLGGGREDEDNPGDVQTVQHLHTTNPRNLGIWEDRNLGI